MKIDRSGERGGISPPVVSNVSDITAGHIPGNRKVEELVVS